MTTKLTEALRAALLAVGIGEPEAQQPVTPSFLTAPTGSILQLSLEEAAELANDPTTDPQTLSALAYRLEVTAEAVQRNLNTIDTATTISSLLPDLDEAIRNTQSGLPTDSTDYGPIYRAQQALGIHYDRVFGGDTAKTLVRYLATQVGSEYEVSAAIDLSQFPNLEGHLREYAETDFFHYTQLVRIQDGYEADVSNYQQQVSDLQAENQALNSRLNLLIKTELAECTNQLIDLDSHDAFAGILQTVSNPYTHFDQEIVISNNLVAEAVVAECKEYFDDTPEELREQLIADFVERVQAPLTDAVNQSIENARLLHQSRLIQTGIVIERVNDFFRSNVPFTLDAQ